VIPGFGAVEGRGPPNILVGAVVGAAGAVDARASSGLGAKRLGPGVVKRLPVVAAAAGCFLSSKASGAGVVGEASLAAGTLNRGAGVEAGPERIKADAGPPRVDNNGGVLGLLIIG